MSGSSDRMKLENELRELSRKQNGAVQDATFLVRLSNDAYAAYEERRRRIQSLRAELTDLDACTVRDVKRDVKQAAG
jgi:hypothetical protein